VHKTRNHHIRELITHFQEVYPATLSLDLSFKDCTARVYTNSAAVRERLLEHYRGFVKPAGQPAFLVTVLETPPFILDEAYDLHVAGEAEVAIASELADRLDGCLVHDRRTGMLTLCDETRRLLVGPATEQLETVVTSIYELYGMCRCAGLDRRRGQARQLAAR
jgi:hypothetical protein